MSLAEFFTVLIASYAAIVSTLSVIYQINEKKRKVKVRAYHGFLGNGGNFSEDMLFLEVANTGNVPVMLQTPSLLLPNRKTFIFIEYGGEDRFPLELLPGHSSNIWIPSQNVYDSLQNNGFSGKIRVTAFVKDKTGRITKSKKRILYNLNSRK